LTSKKRSSLRQEKTRGRRAETGDPIVRSGNLIPRTADEVAFLHSRARLMFNTRKGLRPLFSLAQIASAVSKRTPGGFLFGEAEIGVEIARRWPELAAVRGDVQLGTGEPEPAP
jgi:hypothetical protein